MPSAADISSIIQCLIDLIAGWRGTERGQELRDLHTECKAVLGTEARRLAPTTLIPVSGLDATNLREAIRRHANGPRRAEVRFRVEPVGRFNAALVPYGPADQPPDRWLLAIETTLSARDQVALYAHAVGHLLLNDEAQRLGRQPVMDPASGRSHADILGELRLLESTRDPINRRVLDAYPRFTELLHAPEGAQPLLPDCIREMVRAAQWPAPLVKYDYAYTDGRVSIAAGKPHRGRKKRIDALLRYEASLPIAAIGAVRPGETREQALIELTTHARDNLCVPFAFLVDESKTISRLDWTRHRKANRSRKRPRGKQPRSSSPPCANCWISRSETSRNRLPQQSATRFARHAGRLQSGFSAHRRPQPRS